MHHSWKKPSFFHPTVFPFVKVSAAYCMGPDLSGFCFSSFSVPVKESGPEDITISPALIHLAQSQVFGGRSFLEDTLCPGL